MKGNKHYCLFVVTKTCRTVSYTMLAHSKWNLPNVSMSARWIKSMEIIYLIYVFITESNKPARKINNTFTFFCLSENVKTINGFHQVLIKCVQFQDLQCFWSSNCNVRFTPLSFKEDFRDPTNLAVHGYNTNAHWSRSQNYMKNWFSEKWWRFKTLMSCCK